MKQNSLYRGLSMTAVVASLLISSCKKDGNPNDLPPASGDYTGTISGYKTSDDVQKNNLIAYWGFEDNNNEQLSGVAPTQSAGATSAANGVRGKALSLNAGYLYFANQFERFKTDSLKSWTISAWVKVANNGSKRTMLFQLARPGIFDGSINFKLNTQRAVTPANLELNPTFQTIGGGFQDNLNASIKPAIVAGQWMHLALTYDGTTGVFLMYADAVAIGSYNNRGVGNNLFKAYEPGEIIIGSNYNGIPGKEVNTNVTFAPMTGQVDEMRIWKKTLSVAHIKALYDLGIAGK